ncbi:phytanoyl-CoA dioxygenase family protein [Glycomyces sp. MUSA5-2]|uniref:phytanoyl-CoA dioxygenase family protein n=1 Tax=Glycomyces sp. MUSA5-2 TaxID=2053002 RepID=UPI0030097CB9
MSLTPNEKSTFIREGMLIRRNAVAPELISRARELVDDWYHEAMDPALIDGYTQRTFAPEFKSHPDLLALFAQSPAAELAAELLGTFRPVATMQLQIRVPEGRLSTPQPEKSMHVDGVACPHLDPNELRTFSLLAGVVLSDITDPQGGALHYQPGGHQAMSEWFQSEWSQGLTKQVPPELDAQSGTPFLGRPGDLLLMHHLVPHAVGRNFGAEPRIMVYFRVEHTDHAQRRLDALHDPWLDYQGLRT